MVNNQPSKLNPMGMGERIKKARTSADLNQADLGRLLGVSKGAVSQWESGDVKNLRMANLFRMEDATGFCARWIALGEGPERTQFPADVLSPDELIDETRDFTDEEIAALLRLAAAQLAG